MIRQLIFVDMLRAQGGILSCKKSVDVVPGQQCTILAIVNIVNEAGFREKR